MRAIAWIKERGAEFAEVSLDRSYLRAAGVAVGAAPVPYRLDYEMLVTDRQRTVVGVLQALSCGPDEIARHLAPRADHTERNHYDDWHAAMIAFCDRYRNELRYVERHRADIDIDGLRQELNTRHRLDV